MAGPKDHFRRILAALRRALLKLTGGWAPYAEAAVRSEDLAFQMQSNAIPSRGFFLMLVLSGIIATLGLIADSAPAIIGAMIVAPLMAPIVSMAFGIACVDRKLIFLSAITIAAGTMVVIAIAYVGVAIVGARIAGSEILARTSPSFLDLGIALAAGCAGAFAQTRPSIANSVAGVAIAVALVPPLAVTGIGLSLGRRAISETGMALSEFGLYSGGADIASGAFLLFLTNLIGIVVVAALVFVIQRYGQWQKALVVIALITVVSFGMVPALNEALHEIYVKNRVVRLHAKYARQPTNDTFYGSVVKIERINVEYRTGVLRVSIDLFATRDRLEKVQERVDRFQNRLSTDIGEPVVVEADIIPIDLLRVRSGPPEAKR